MFKKLFVSCGLILFLLAVPYTAEQAFAKSPQKQVVVHLKEFSPDFHSVKMALVFANQFLKDGAAVTLLLSLEGVRLVDQNQPINMVWGPYTASANMSGEQKQIETVEDMYTAFIAAGGQVLACPGCSAVAGCRVQNLRKGARIGSLADISKMLLQADLVLDY